MLDYLNTENKNFQAYHAEMMNERKDISRGLSLLSFLIKPVQRLCKYPLLLRYIETRFHYDNCSLFSLSL